MLAKFEKVRLAWDESGQTLIEYGLLIMLIVLVVAATLPPIGTAITNMFTAVVNGF